MALEIVRWPNPILTRSCREVSPEELRSDSTQNLINEMLKMVADHRKQGWVGLAANQVGYDGRIFVGYLGENDLQVVVDPQVEILPGKTKLSHEGCVSLEGVNLVVPRRKKVALRLLDRDGREIKRRVAGYYAAIVQHETDHLNGRLIYY